MKRLLLAVLWSIFCFGVMWAIGRYAFNFDVLSANNWDTLFDRNLTVWPQNIAPRRIICRTLLVGTIIFVFGLGICLKRKRPPKGMPVFVPKTEQRPTVSTMPARMPPQGKIASFQAPVPPTTNTTPATQAAPEHPAITTFNQVVNQITAAVKDFDASAFPHVKLENTFTPLIISDDSTALLLKILVHDGLWQVQSAPAIEDSVWTIDNLPPQKLMKDVIDSTRTLARLEPDAEAITTIVLVKGSFQDIPGTLEYLKSQNVRITTFLPENATIEGIPTLTELLSEYYQPKQEEGEEEHVNPNDEV